MFNVLYKNTHHRQVLDLPVGLSEPTILKALHDHDFMIRTTHPDCEIKADSATLDSATFKIKEPKSGWDVVVTLTAVDDGLWMCVEVMFGMRMTFQWTVHERSALAHEDMPCDSGMEKPTFAHDQDHAPGSLFLLEEMSLRIFRPFLSVLGNRTKSVTVKHILGLLESLKEGNGQT